MNKKIFGVKVKTYLTAIGCIALAIVFWVAVKTGFGSDDAASAINLFLN